MLSDRQLEERKLRQERILSSALEVFKANGLDGATMDSIAEKAGFGKATLYYYFSSKEEVFLGIMEEGWKSNAKNRPNLYEFLFQAPKVINLTDFDDQKWKKHQSQLYSVLMGLLEDGITLKEFPKLDSNLMFKAIGGLFTGLIFFGDEEKKSISENEVEALLNNLISKQ